MIQTWFEEREPVELINSGRLAKKGFRRLPSRSSQQFNPDRRLNRSRGMCAHRRVGHHRTELTSEQAERLRAARSVGSRESSSSHPTASHDL
jgi:hypothetical protein